MFSNKYPLLTPEVCRKAQERVVRGEMSCCALGGAASGSSRRRPLWPEELVRWDTAFEQASKLLQAQGEFRLCPLGDLTDKQAATARVMYLELLALAQEDGLL